MIMLDAITWIQKSMAGKNTRI